MLGRLARALLPLLALLFVATTTHAEPRGAPASGVAVPDPLKPWTGWVLDGVDRCPVFYDHVDLTRCAWPARLELIIGDKGGSFTQTWHVDTESAVPLPGSAKRWPVDVTVDGKPGVVVGAGGEPRLELSPGEHVVRGTFSWDSVPESIPVPKETGLLALTLRGAPVASPNRDAQGTVWLQKAATNEEGDSLGIVVHRKITDDVPMRVTTRLELHVSGKSREELLGKALLPGFVPMVLDSQLPARVESDGRIRVQVRPGVFTLDLVARATGYVSALTRPPPGGPWKDGDEVWVFEAKSDYRVVRVEGVASIDPQQTTLPEAWKRLPAYPMKVGATLRFVESRRGDADPPPDQLTLARSLWLDFDGQGYTVQDVLTGTLNRESRLTMAPPTVLGRVAIDGHDQFITELAGTTGVEVREAQLSVTADSRIATGGHVSNIPAVGWAHDFHQVTGTLHLPPGWTLLFATGVDDVAGTWVRHWSLLEIFVALIIGIVVGRLYGAAWGALTLAMLVLTLPEAGAPEWVWAPLLVLEALVRVIPKGRVQTLLAGARVAAFLLVAVIVVPFAVQQVRQGLHPALLQSELVVGSGQSTVDSRETSTMVAMDKTAAAEAVPAAPPAASATAKADRAMGRAGGGARLLDIEGSLGSPSSLPYQSNSQVYDPTAVVQTGPGLPRWSWTTLQLRWSGPVGATQRLHLYLVSPGANLVLSLLRSALLLLVVLRLFPYGARAFPRLYGAPPPAALAVLLAMSSLVFAPRPARADIPDKALLDDLKARLTKPPPCSPTCASSGRMAIDVRDGTLRLRVEIDAAATTAVPLPGKGAQWSPLNVRVDGEPAKALVRVDDVLWVALDPGVHQVVLEGPMPDRASMQLALPLPPHHVEVAATGWTVAGVHEDGLADDDLQLTRTEGPKGHEASLQPGTLPPFVVVTRTLHIGLDWEVETQVDRVTPVGSAVVLAIPLLVGEKVTTDMRVVAGKAQVFLGLDAKTVQWRSVLPQKSPIRLVAPKDVAWTEVWRMDVGPIWHARYEGIPFVHTAVMGGAKTPTWRPWPGEEATVDLSRPEGVSGQSLTIDESRTDVRPGLRATDMILTVDIRSSRGGDHTITLADGAELESLTLNGASQPIRQEGRKVTIPIVPGVQKLELVFRTAAGLGAVFTSPAVDLGAPSVNATVTLGVPNSRWLLFTKGPIVGPTVLFWSLLAVLMVVAVALGQNRWTPLRTWHWALLFVGLSQVDVVVAGFFVGWLLALGYRARHRADDKTGSAGQWLNLGQVVLVAWTIAALVILAVSLHQGLLGTPEMQVTGNGSDSSLLRWFVDRSGPLLPQVTVVSVPLLVYRAAMLAWALWIVLSLLAWLRWGWGAFTNGGAWKKGPRKPPRVPRNYAVAYDPAAVPPPAAPVVAPPEPTADASASEVADTPQSSEPDRE